MIINKSKHENSIEMKMKRKKKENKKKFIYLKKFESTAQHILLQS